MRYLKHLAIISSGLLAATGATAASFTEDFDTAPYGSWESRWFGTNSNAQNYYVSEYGDSPDWKGGPDVHGLWLTDGDNWQDGGDYANINLRFDTDFAASLTSFSLDIASALQSATLVFYDTDGATLGSFTVPNSPVSAYYTPTGYNNFSITSTNGIGGFDILGYAQGNVIVDNLNAVTATAAVPEPASWAMMIAGFGLVGGAMRRRTRVAYAAL
ncbi:PEPxxWA-CTERM sorting domain-containing protein [Sphingomonas sp. ID0503]|uniref:PEPxxWA-CTERM sorting domain-containing protein n=1 Tax=Sphingomonas sp. ID0503 TaxID=3399691 RepID=UPI003AFA2831